MLGGRCALPVVRPPQQLPFAFIARGMAVGVHAFVDQVCVCMKTVRNPGEAYLWRRVLTRIGLSQYSSREHGM